MPRFSLPPIQTKSDHLFSLLSPPPPPTFSFSKSQRNILLLQGREAEAISSKRRWGKLLFLSHPIHSQLGEEIDNAS